MILTLLDAAAVPRTEITDLSANWPWPIFPFPAIIGATAICLMSGITIVISWYFDKATRGFLTISLVIVMAFVAATFASMIYSVPNNPATEILVGALSTALGAVISHWVGRAPRRPGEKTNGDVGAIVVNGTENGNGKANETQTP